MSDARVPRRRSPRAAGLIGLCLAATLVLAGCSGDDDSPTPTTEAPATTTTVAPIGNRTPCANAEEAARAVEAAWTAADQSGALRCATPEAVARLFATTSGDASIRSFAGCTPAAPDSPVMLCAFNEPGRSVTLEVEPVRDGGFYVTTVKVGSAG